MELREKIMVPALQDAGFNVEGLSNALELYRRWSAAPFELVLLDVGLPDEDGVEIARHLRALTPSPGIVLYTGHGHIADRLRGLRSGADAYLVKPLDMDVVVETLHNLRTRLRGSAGVEARPDGRWSLDRHGWSLAAPSGSSLALNQAERQILRVLMATPGEPVPREALIASLTGDVSGFDPHRLEMLIYRLRRKCLQTCGQALPLQAVRGVGYLFEP